MSNFKKVLEVLEGLKEDIVQLNEDDTDAIQNLKAKFKDFDEFLGYSWSKWIKNEDTKKYLRDTQTEFRKLAKTVGWM